MGKALEGLHRRQVEGGDDEQNGVGAHRPRLVNLVGIDDEILTQHGQFAGSTRGLQIRRRPLKKLPVGQHRQAGCTVRRIIGGNISRLEIAAQNAFRRAGLFDFGNNRRLAGRPLTPYRADEITGGRACQRLGLHGCQRLVPLRLGDFVAFNGKNFLQNIAHRFFSLFIESFIF